MVEQMGSPLAADRPTASSVLDGCKVLFNNPFIEAQLFMQQWADKGIEQKNRFMDSLEHQVDI